jgi:hypothetical protein
MPPKLPTDLERDLFAAALDLRRAEPWRHLTNIHYLLIAEPAGGRRAFTVLGNGGQQYGLQSYAASCAPQFLVLVEELPRIELVSPTIFYELVEAVEVELTTKGKLDQHDLARASRCGYRPPRRSRQAWPRFRAYRRNRFPWHIDESHARLLLGDLRRALRWAELTPTLPQPDPEQPVALRQLPVVAEELPTDRPWTQADVAWERLVMPPTPAVPVLPVDSARLAEWRTCPLDPALELIVDERAPLIRIKDEAGGAPWFPRVGLCLDNHRGMVIGQKLGAADEPFGLNALRALEFALGALGRRPGLIIFVNPNLPKALAAWLHPAEIRAGLSSPLAALDEIWSYLY